jgi:hypothetical protein
VAKVIRCKVRPSRVLMRLPSATIAQRLPASERIASIGVRLARCDEYQAASVLVILAERALLCA